MQVEHTADCFGGAWFKSPLSTKVWHPRHIWQETAFQFAEELALNGETYVVSINEFSATCNRQVVGVQVEQNRCKVRASRKAVTLGSPSTGVIAHVHPETSLLHLAEHIPYLSDATCCRQCASRSFWCRLATHISRSCQLVDKMAVKTAEIVCQRLRKSCRSPYQYIVQQCGVWLNIGCVPSFI